MRKGRSLPLSFLTYISPCYASVFMPFFPLCPSPITLISLFLRFPKNDDLMIQAKARTSSCVFFSFQCLFVVIHTTRDSWFFFYFYFLCEPEGSSRAQKIEDVVDWREVVRRYLAMRGSQDVDGDDTSGTVERVDALDDLSALGGDQSGLAAI